jgi:hypothetical protein
MNGKASKLQPFVVPLPVPVVPLFVRPRVQEIVSLVNEDRVTALGKLIPLCHDW